MHKTRGGDRERVKEAAERGTEKGREGGKEGEERKKDKADSDQSRAHHTAPP